MIGLNIYVLVNRSTVSKSTGIRAIPSPPDQSIIIDPTQQRIVIRTLMLRPPAWTGFCVSLKARICRAHHRLTDIIETMCGVLGDFWRQFCASEAGLEVFY